MDNPTINNTHAHSHENYTTNEQHVNIPLIQ